MLPPISRSRVRLYWDVGALVRVDPWLPKAVGSTVRPENARYEAAAAVSS
jgi:hypothetical protein